MSQATVAGQVWRTTLGQEWQTLADAASFTTAYHLLRVLAGGITGGLGLRSNNEMRNLRRCCCCNCLAEHVAAAWTSHAEGHPGVSW